MKRVCLPALLGGLIASSVPVSAGGAEGLPDFVLVRDSLFGAPVVAAGAPRAEQQSAASSFSGDWALVRLKEYTGEGTSRKVLTRTFSSRDANMVGRISPGPAGTLFISGAHKCIPGGSPGSGMPAWYWGNPSLFPDIVSAMHIIKVLYDISQDARCIDHRMVTDQVVFYPHHEWLGRPATGLYKNLGVFGEGGESADAECRGLRGYRVMEQPSTNEIFCVGYVDGSSRKLRMLLQPAGEIYVSRADFVRVGGE